MVVRSTIWAPKQHLFFPDLGLLHSFGHALKPVILGAALCWQQKCFKWAILNKEFNRKKIFHHLQIQDWAVGPQDPHRSLTWNRRIHCSTGGSTLIVLQPLVLELDLDLPLFIIYFIQHFLQSGSGCFHVLSRLWNSLTWNRSTIWDPKQFPLCTDLGYCILWKCF